MHIGSSMRDLCQDGHFTCQCSRNEACYRLKYLASDMAQPNWITLHLWLKMLSVYCAIPEFWILLYPRNPSFCIPVLWKSNTYIFTDSVNWVNVAGVLVWNEVKWNYPNSRFPVCVGFRNHEPNISIYILAAPCSSAFQVIIFKVTAGFQFLCFAIH